MDLTHTRAARAGQGLAARSEERAPAGRRHRHDLAAHARAHGRAAARAGHPRRARARRRWARCRGTCSSRRRSPAAPTRTPRCRSASRQTISQPYVVARMIEVLLDGKQPGKVLEVGTGCGYQAAVLAQLFPEVYSIERIKGLHERARANLLGLRLPTCAWCTATATPGWRRRRRSSRSSWPPRRARCPRRCYASSRPVAEWSCRCTRHRRRAAAGARRAQRPRLRRVRARPGALRADGGGKGMKSAQAGSAAGARVLGAAAARPAAGRRRSRTAAARAKPPAAKPRAAAAPARRRAAPAAPTGSTPSSGRHALQHRARARRRLPRARAVERARRPDQAAHRPGAARQARRAAARAPAWWSAPARGAGRVESRPLDSRAAAQAERRHEDRAEGRCACRTRRKTPHRRARGSRRADGERVDSSGRRRARCSPASPSRAARASTSTASSATRWSPPRRPRHLHRHRHPGPRQAGRDQARQRLHHRLRAQQGHPGEGAAERDARPEDRRARQHRRRPAEAALPDPQGRGGGRPDALPARVL